MNEEELSEEGLMIWQEFIDIVKTVQDDSWFTEEEEDDE